MKKYIKPALAIFTATIFISFWEFLRNELIFKSYWTDHYQSLGLEFPSEPINGFVWGVWSLAMAVLIFILLTRFSILQSTAIAWLASFVMMWLVVGNLAVLPFGILIFAVPLSIIEVLVAAWIINKINGPKFKA